MMANIRRNIYNETFKLKTIELGIKEGNGATVLNFNINESMSRLWMTWGRTEPVYKDEKNLSEYINTFQST